MTLRVIGSTKSGFQKELELKNWGMGLVKINKRDMTLYINDLGKLPPETHGLIIEIREEAPQGE